MKIDIAFGLHDPHGTYSVWVGAVMQSIIEHTSSPICFHILHDDTLSALNRERLTQVGSQANHQILFHLIDRTVFDSIRIDFQRYTVGTMFRLLIPELMPDQRRIIYLDADLVVNRDMRELWEINVDDYALAAVRDANTQPDSRKFNAGVLLMNLDRIRAKGNLCQIATEYLNAHPESHYLDQDVLNAVFGDDTLLIDSTWNRYIHEIRNAGTIYKKNPRNGEAAIYHFVGITYSILHAQTAPDFLLYETIRHTPWADEMCPEILSRNLGRVNWRLSLMETLVRRLSASRERHIFYCNDALTSRLVGGLLTIRDGDYRIEEHPTERPGDILPCKPLEALREETEPYLVFVWHTSDGGRAIQNLEALGLKNEQDFFVMANLLSFRDGGFIL